MRIALKHYTNDIFVRLLQINVTIRTVTSKLILIIQLLIMGIYGGIIWPKTI